MRTDFSPSAEAGADGPHGGPYEFHRREPYK